MLVLLTLESPLVQERMMLWWVSVVQVQKTIFPVRDPSTRSES